MKRLIVTISIIGFSTSLFAWSSLRTTGAFATHQFLNRKTYEELKEHPAIKEGYVKFPSLDQIQHFSGIGPTQSGEGPDNPNLTDYTWHYYNPAINLGMAPQLTQFLYDRLRLKLLNNNLIDKKKLPPTKHNIKLNITHC